MEKLKLTDVIPAKPIFRLSAFAGHDFTVRAPNMEDQVWFIENYDTLRHAQEVMANKNWSEICRIVYYLMSSEDRAFFPAKTDDAFTDESGRLVQRVWLGWQELLKRLNGIPEAAGMLSALTRAIMNSNPLIEKGVEDVLKKNLAAMRLQQKSITPIS